LYSFLHCSINTFASGSCFFGHGCGYDGFPPDNKPANLLAILGALLIVGLNVMGMSADKFGAKSALILSFTLMTVAFLLIILSEEIWVLYLFAGFAGFAAGGLQVLFSPVIAELFGVLTAYSSPRSFFWVELVLPLVLL